MRLRLFLLSTVGMLVLITGCSGSDAPDAPLAAPPPEPVTITVPATAQPINPTEPIVVQVSGGTLDKVAVTDPAGKPLTGGFAPDSKTWTSNQPLAFDTEYTVTAQAVDLALRVTDQTFTVDTINPTLAYANVVPAPNFVADVGIGVGQPMVFEFTKPVVNKAEVQKHLVITSDPPQPGAWYWTDDMNVHYRGPEYWKPGTKLHIEANVFGLDLGNGVFGAENNAADYTVHDSWIAKADGATKVLTVFHNGAQVNSMPMSLGSPGNPSHEGPHVISERAHSVIMDSCTYGVCKGDPNYYREEVFLNLRISYDGEFVHSAPWSVGEQGNANVSHGCVNLAPDNAQWMFDHFGIGDVVEISNSGGPRLPVWDRYGDWEVPWEQWQAGNA
ncbi:L,D-transpeptidase [Skermania piniformis]|nr:Ig-like domain-containing protein [Skermania piniformis]